MKENEALEIDKLEDIAFPIPKISKFYNQSKPHECSVAIKKIIRGAVKGAYQQKDITSYDLNYRRPESAFVSSDEVNFVIHLIESLEPSDAIEAALASQFAVSYIRGMNNSQADNLNKSLQLFEFGHAVIDVLRKHRAAGKSNETT